jgi:DUF1680 family protein
VKQETEYPWDGTICFTVSSEMETGFGIRIPGWADEYTVTVNGERVKPDIRDGYMYFRKQFDQDVISLKLAMRVEKWHANPLVGSDLGRTAIMRGPLVYCLEEVDNGSNLQLLSIDSETEFQYEFSKEELGGVGVIYGNGHMRQIPSETPLYSKGELPGRQTEKRLKWIPYYAWANRGENEMLVWIREGKERISDK